MENEHNYRFSSTTEKQICSINSQNIFENIQNSTKCSFQKIWTTKTFQQKIFFWKSFAINKEDTSSNSALALFTLPLRHSKRTFQTILAAICQ